MRLGVLYLLLLAAVLLSLGVALPHLLHGGEAGAAATPVSSGCGGGSGSLCSPVGSVYLVIIGTESCPHCRAMEGFLPGMGAAVFFCEIAEKGSTCAKAFMELFTSGVAPGVPVVAACSNLSKSLLFIEVGEYRNATWWRRVLLNPPREPEVYVAGKPKSSLDPVLAEKLSRLICVDAVKDAKQLSPRR